MSPIVSYCGNKKMMTVWLAVAVGAAVGIGFVLSRRRPRDRWASARDITRKVSEHSGDFAERGKEIIERAQNIYQEGCKIVEDATALWSQGRKVVGA